MENEPSYFDICETILSAIRARLSDAKREYGLDAEAVEVIEQPARTVVIRDNRSGGIWVQASISLRGDSIEIKRPETIAAGVLSDEPEVIEIEVKNGVVAYIHDDIDRTTDPHRVADTILNPIFDCYRAAS
jgi:hypothetical protein